jgi:predicted nucleic acid-binding protein
MNIVDSSGWLEYFANGPNADFFAPAIEDTEQLIVPSISIYEVFKRVLQQRAESDAVQAIAVMEQGAVVDLSSSLALIAARLSLQHRLVSIPTRPLPLADSVILATARAHTATLWTQDADFRGIEGVRHIERKA